jgi:RNA polymerase sigma factor (sigma-70 family)
VHFAASSEAAASHWPLAIDKSDRHRSLLGGRVRIATRRRIEFRSSDDALDALGKIDERKSRVVELRFFGGLSVEETASVLKVSPETVMRDWKLAKAWLLRELRGGGPSDA